jgi:hypothetical protein
MDIGRHGMSAQNRPVVTAMAVTQSIHHNGRGLHFATDQGPVVVVIPDLDMLRDFGEMLTDEADEWEADEWEADEWEADE